MAAAARWRRGRGVARDSALNRRARASVATLGDVVIRDPVLPPGQRGSDVHSRRPVEILKFLFQAATAGLAAAFVALWLFPELAGGSFPGAPPAAAQARPSYHAAVMAVAPAVANVYATKIRETAVHPLFQDPLFKRFFGDAPPERQVDREFGSGVIVNSEGYLLTNLHIVREAEEIQVTLNDGRQMAARIVGTDPDTELAVLQLESTEDLPEAPIGDSDQLLVGDVVLAIGNPYDFGQTVTQGIVSATGRKSLGITTFEDFIQTDADINPGNSGGALINAAGEVIGINTANYSETGSGGSQGIGFAIPINLAMSVMSQVIEFGHVVRGWLGIEAREVPQDTLAAAGLENGGVLVAVVLQGGPAALSGIRPGDILTAINGEPLHGPRQAIALIAQFPPNTIIRLSLLRGWEQIEVESKVGQRPAFLR
jgi:Do/DeqQ family serine protease